MTLLELKNVSVSYGRIEAIHDMSFAVDEGEIVSLIGANGAGKSTTMKTISGLLNPRSGSITFDGEDITKMKAHIRVVKGISQAPEGRGVFPGMTVLENLDMGTFGLRDRSGVKAGFERV
ncbi:MAG: branched-chain amino acid transport system ATP-binding protein, partial [Microbacteriaceae bacterium]|nr:branched-chain amino acid transport system ATP-binding protein [Microbacteriaceae bacterium]